MTQGDLTVAAISAEEHLAFLEAQRSASFLQTPAWAAVKPEWRAESIGWRTAAGELVGAALVLHRPIPRLRRWTLAYLPEGPVIDWETDDLAAWRPAYEAPLRLAYGRYEVAKCGPWSQGPVFLQSLALLAGCDLDHVEPDSAEFVHLLAEALKTANPPGIDVSSGVESTPGVKDVERIRAFFAAVEAARA